MISSADLLFKGMQNMYPVSMQTTVRAYLLPLDEGGWNSPIKSILTNSIGCTPGSNICFSNWVFWTFCSAQTLQFFAVFQNLCSHLLPVVQLLDHCICPLVSIVSWLVGTNIKHYIHQQVRNDPYLEFVAIIYNRPEKNIISDKVESLIHTTFNFVAKFPNFWVIRKWIFFIHTTFNFVAKFPNFWVIRKLIFLSSSGSSTDNSKFLGLSHVKSFATNLVVVHRSLHFRFQNNIYQTHDLPTLVVVSGQGLCLSNCLMYLLRWWPFLKCVQNLY